MKTTQMKTFIIIIQIIVCICLISCKKENNIVCDGISFGMTSEELINSKKISNNVEAGFYEDEIQSELIEPYIYCKKFDSGIAYFVNDCLFGVDYYCYQLEFDSAISVIENVRYYIEKEYGKPDSISDYSDVEETQEEQYKIFEWKRENKIILVFLQCYPDIYHVRLHIYDTNLDSLRKTY